MAPPENADDHVQVDIAERVATIRLCRPAKRNAVTTAMYARLAQTFGDLVTAAEADIVVLTGSGGSFTAGNDLADMMAHPNTDEDSPPRRFLDALVALPQVLVIGVDGPAIGIGTTVLLHADLVLATRAARFALPFVQLGLVPEAASTLLLPAAVGHVRAAELLLLGRSFSAEEAAAWGLVNALVDGGQAQLDVALSELVHRLRSQPAVSLLHTRRLLREHRLEATQRRLVADGALMSELIRANAGFSGTSP